MKYLFTALLFFTFFTCSYAQINWSEFKEPDGILQRLTIDPRISFSSSNSDFTNSDQTTFRGQLLTRYSVDKVSENNIINIFASHNLVHNRDNLSTASTPQNRTENEINLSGTYTHYLNARRGIFLRAQPNFIYNYMNTTNNGSQHANQLNGRFVVGYGRLENVSTVYQAIRIDKNLYGNEGFDQEKLFNLATQLRSIDYNNALDSRMRTVENQAIYLQTLEDYGYDVSTYVNIANAIDMFRFERPFTLKHGFEVSAGLLPFISISNYSDFLASVNATYARAINDTWHWTVDGEMALHAFGDDLNDGYVNIRNNVSYIPTARTQINFTQSFFSRSNSTQLLLIINGSYFVSPQLNIFVNTSFSNNTSSNLSSNRFFHDMGLKYYIF